MNLLYLGGPITGLAYGQATDWRKYVSDNVPDFITAVSPLRYKEYLAGETNIADSYEMKVLSSAKGITSRDHFDLHRCDAFLANFTGADKASIGTVMEIAWAFAYRKPTVVVMDEKNVHWHAMVRESVGWIVPTLDEAIHVVSAILSTGV